MTELFACGIASFLIEGSRRPTDQPEHLQQMLAKLTVADRQMIVGIVEKLSLRLAGRKASFAPSISEATFTRF
jgi:hypothetical protein